MLAAFREQPGNAAHAARRANCDPRAARRAWVKGWPNFGWGRPIKDVIDEEQAAGRAAALRAADARREEADKARDARREAAVKAYEQEGQIIAGMRGNVGLAVGVVRTLLRVASVLQAQLVEDVEKGGALKDLAPLAKLTTLSAIARTADTLTRACSAVIEWDRKHYGDPTIAITPTEEEAMSPEDAARELAGIKQSLEQAAALGFEVLKGGVG